MTDKLQTQDTGLVRVNAAEPLGEKKGVSSNAEVETTGEKGPRNAGPDGPDPTEASEVAR